MRRRRLAEPDFDRLTKIAWTLLAVDRFGSFGSEAEVGGLLERSGLIQARGKDFILTTKGKDLARKINESRGIDGH